MPPTPAAVRSAYARSANALRGVVLLVVGTGILTLNDAVVKWLAGSLPVGEVLTLRGLATFLPIAVIAAMSGGVSSLRVRDWRGQSIRAGLVVASTWMFVTGLTLLPLADVIAVAFVNPLFVTALAPLFLGERVGWRRWTAVLVGFGGVLVIVQPTGDPRLAALLPLGAAFCGALRDIVTRSMSVRGESTVATLAVMSAATAASGLLSWPFLGPWIWPTTGQFVLVVLSGILLGTAHWCMIEALRWAQAALIAPFKYTSFLWAILLGFLIWGDVPTVVTLVGAAIVVASGLYVFQREVLGRPREGVAEASEDTPRS